MRCALYNHCLEAFARLTATVKRKSKCLKTDIMNGNCRVERLQDICKCFKLLLQLSNLLLVGLKAFQRFLKRHG